jgi:hypothetical protein
METWVTIVIVIVLILYLLIGLFFNRQYHSNRINYFKLIFEKNKLIATHSYYSAMIEDKNNKIYIGFHAPEFLIFNRNFESDDQIND